MVATIRTISIALIALLLIAGLLATGLWIIIPVLLVGLVVWIAASPRGPQAR
jgi:hypothetical protein